MVNAHCTTAGRMQKVGTQSHMRSNRDLEQRRHSRLRGSSSLTILALFAVGSILLWSLVIVFVLVGREAFAQTRPGSSEVQDGIGSRQRWYYRDFGKTCVSYYATTNICC